MQGNTHNDYLKPLYKYRKGNVPPLQQYEGSKYTVAWQARVTGSNFNKYPAAYESAELIDWTHKQLKRITFVKQQVYSVCNQGKYPT